jgi:hypothetical protein
VRPAGAVPVRAAGPVLALALVVSGCASQTTATTELPGCEQGDDGQAANGVVLMAQSVPSATWVPCLRTALPNGWRFFHLDARDGVSTFWLNSNRDGNRAIEVRLEPSCDSEGATEIPSDHEGMHRLERVSMTTPHFEGERYYVFDGGCITVVFRLEGDARGEGLALATDAVGVVSRTDLRDQVHDESDGRLDLDPAGDGNG